jgi:hypothetical protein
MIQLNRMRWGLNENLRYGDNKQRFKQNITRNNVVKLLVNSVITLLKYFNNVFM